MCCVPIHVLISIMKFSTATALLVVVALAVGTVTTGFVPTTAHNRYRSVAVAAAARGPFGGRLQQQQPHCTFGITRMMMSSSSTATTAENKETYEFTVSAGERVYE